MCDPDNASRNAGSDRSDFQNSEPVFDDGLCGSDLPFHFRTAADAVDVVARGIADCLPVRVAVLDADFRVRALNTEWRRLGALGTAASGQRFVDACLSTASVSDRNYVATRLAKLGQMHSEGFVTSIGLGLGGTHRSFTLRARLLSKAPGFVVVALLDRAGIELELSTIARIVLDAEDGERRRIARELHDETAQQLAAMQMGLADLRKYGAGDKFERTCCDMESMLHSVQHELRTLSYTLHPPEIDDAGLAEALGRFVKGFARRTRLKAVFIDEAKGPSTDGVTDRALYRVTQEALINVGKHAEATNAVVSLRALGERLVLDVEDDGIGIAPDLCSSRADARLGVGLSAMRARIEALAGKFEVSRLQKGTRVRAILPVRDCGRDAMLMAL